MNRGGAAPAPPVVIPAEHREEVMRLSKAALADMAWWLCASRLDYAATIDEFRFQARRVLDWREREARKE